MHLAATSPNIPIIIYIWLGLLVLASLLTRLAWREYLAQKRQEAQREREVAQWPRRIGEIVARRSTVERVGLRTLTLEEFFAHDGYLRWPWTKTPIESFFFDLRHLGTEEIVTVHAGKKDYESRPDGTVMQYAFGKFSPGDETVRLIVTV